MSKTMAADILIIDDEADIRELISGILQDEGFETLTLVQTGKIRRFPIILMQSSFWSPLVHWFRTALVHEKVISPEDMDLIQIIDEPQAVVNAIFDHYATRGFEPSPAERALELNL